MHKPKGNGGHGHGHTPAELNPEAVKAGHEVGDVQLKPIYNFLIGLTLLSVVSFVVVYVVFQLFAGYKSRTSEKLTPMAQRQVGQLPPEPRLQVDALKEWVVFKAEQDSVVATYGWVDKGKGVVRLPLDRALEVMAEKPWPHRPGHYAKTGLSGVDPVTTTGAAGGAAAEPAHAPAAASAHDAPAETPAAGSH